MKKMLLPRPLALAFPLLLALAMLCSNGLGGLASAQSVCPSPLPTCTAPGNLADLSGTLACTEVETKSGGIVQPQLILVTFDGKGNFSSKKARNSNDPNDPTTYQDFSAGGGGTYCINTDDTGYITPPSGSGGCPEPFVIDATKTELRLMDSTEQTAKVALCRQQ